MCHTFIIPIYAWPSYIVYTHTVQSVCMYYICIYHVFSVTVSHILYLHYLDFPEISEITSCFTFWVSSCDLAIIQANIWIWYKYITYTKSYHVLVKYKMHVSSISLNIFKSVLYFDSVRIPLTWLNQFQLYIYILLPNPWQPLFYFSCFFPRKLTRLGNPCWLKGIPTFSFKPYFCSPPWPWIFPRKVSGNLRLNTQTKPKGCFFGPKIDRHLANPPPPVSGMKGSTN